MVNFGKECREYKEVNPARSIPIKEYIDNISKKSRLRLEQVLLCDLHAKTGYMCLSHVQVSDHIYDRIIFYLFGLLPYHAGFLETYNAIDKFLNKNHYTGGTVYPYDMIASVVDQAFINAKDFYKEDIEVSALFSAFRLRMIRGVPMVLDNRSAGYHKVRLAVKQVIYEVLFDMCKKDITDDTIEVQEVRESIYSTPTYHPMSLKGVCYQTDTRDRKFLRLLDTYTGDKYDELYDVIWKARELNTNPILTREQVEILVALADLKHT